MATSDLPPASGRDIRRWTRHRVRHHSDATISELVGDVYTVVLAVVMGSSMVFSLTSGLAVDDPTERTPTQAATTIGHGLPPGWLLVLTAVAVTASLIAVATRLGPVALPAAESTWWLPLPVDRRTLLRPAAYWWPAAAAVLGAVQAVAIAVGVDAAPGLLAVSAALGAAILVTLVAAAGLAQNRPAAHHAVQAAADVVLATTPIGGILLTLTGWAPPTPGRVLPLATALAVGAAVVLTLTWDRRLGDIPGTSLRSQGAATDEALVAVLSLDPRGLGRALATRTEQTRRRRSSTLPWLARTPAPWRPTAALITSDLLLFLRTPRHLAQVAISTSLPALALLASRPGTATVAVAVLTGAYTAALGTAEGARRAHVNPALDAVLPLGHARVRLARLVVPALAMLLWWSAACSLLAWRYADPAGWLALGMSAAPLWAASAVRGAYRPLPDFGGPLIYTPMGAVPPGLSAIATKGPDLAVLGSAPLIAALILNQVTPPLLVLQVVLTVAAIAVVTRPPSTAG